MRVSTVVVLKFKNVNTEIIEQFLYLMLMEGIFSLCSIFLFDKIKRFDFFQLERDIFGFNISL